MAKSCSGRLTLLCAEPPPRVAEETVGQATVLCEGLPLALCVVGGALARQQPSDGAWKVRPEHSRAPRKVGATDQVQAGSEGCSSFARLRLTASGPGQVDATAESNEASAC